MSDPIDVEEPAESTAAQQHSVHDDASALGVSTAAPEIMRAVGPVTPCALDARPADAAVLEHRVREKTVENIISIDTKFDGSSFIGTQILRCYDSLNFLGTVTHAWQEPNTGVPLFRIAYHAGDCEDLTTAELTSGQCAMAAAATYETVE